MYSKLHKNTSVGGIAASSDSSKPGTTSKGVSITIYLKPAMLEKIGLY